jgi:hypothetical protein
MPFIDGKYVSPSLGDLPTNSSPNSNSWDLQSQLYASTNFNMTNNPEPFQGGFAKDYEDYFPTGWSKYTNVDELRALKQSTLEKWRNAAGKFIVTAGTTALDGTIGTVIGLGNMMMGGQDGQSSGDDFWNNPFSQEMNKWQADSERLMPNFKSQAEKELSAFGSLGTANFWADTVFKNAGFAVGAIATGAGWANLAKTGAKRLFPAYGKIVAQDLSNAARIASGEITGAELAQSVISSAKAAKYANFGQQAFGAFMGSLGESRFEAIGAAEGLKSQLQNTGQWDKLTDEEREEAIKSTGNAVFASNMALLSVSNFIQFKNIFSKPLEFNRLKSNLIRQGSTVAAKKLSPYKYAAGILGRNMATEGLFEEGGQYAIEKGVTHFNAQKVNDKEANSELASIINSTMYGLEQAYTTKGGWEAILSGSIIGGIMSNISPVTSKNGKVKLTAPGQGFRKDLADARATNALSEIGAINVNNANTRLTAKLKQIYGEASEQVKQLQAIYTNNPSKQFEEEDIQKIKDLRDGIVRSLAFAREKVKALESGDVFGYKSREDMEFANDIFTLIKNDRLEDFFNTLDNTANYSGEELRKIYAEDSSKIGVSVDPNKIKSSDEIAQEHRERTAKIKQNAKRVADIYNAIGVKTNGVLKSAAHYELTSMMYLSEKLDRRQDSIIKSLESNLKTNNRFNFEDLSPEDRETITRVLKVTKKDTGLKTDNEFIQEAIDRAELDSSVRTLLEDLNSLNKNKREKAKEKLSDILSLKNAEDILGINAGEKSTKELIQELKDVTRIASLKDNTAKSIKMAVEDPEAFNQLVDRNIIKGLDDSFFEEQLPVYKRYKETVIALEQIEEDLQRAIEQETRGDQLNSESTMGNQEEIAWEFMKARILDGIFEPNAKTMWRGWQTFIKSIASHQSIVEGDKGFRWFTFLEKIRSKEIGREDVDFIIANVDSIPENLRSVVEPFYEDKIVAKGEDIKIIVVNKDGSPYLIDGKSVESNLGLPTQYHTNIATERFSMKEFEQDTIAANPNISRSELEAVIQDQWDQGIAKYKEFRESVKQSAKKVKISSYNPGDTNFGNGIAFELTNVLGSVVPSDTNLEDLLNSIYIETWKSTNELFVEREVKGKKYKLVPGFAYLEANDQLYPLEHNLLQEADINNIIDIVTYLAKNKSNSEDIVRIKSFLQSLVNTYYSNKNSGGLFQFWIDTTLEDKEFKGIVFGNNRLSAADILNGNLEELKTFLGTKKYNVSKKHLAQTNYEHLRVVNGKLVTTSTNYLKFLLDERIQVSEPREEDYKNILNPPKWNPSLSFKDALEPDNVNDEGIEFRGITTAPIDLFLPEENQVVLLSPQTATLEDYIKNLRSFVGEIITIENKTGVLNITEGGVVTLESNNVIYEFGNVEDVFSKNIEISLDFNVQNNIVNAPKYTITNLTENTFTLNGNDYTFEVNDIGNVVSVSPVNKPEQKITNKNILIFLEIQRNKLDYNNISDEVLDNSEVDKKIRSINELRLLETIQSEGFSDNVANALDKLYAGEELNDAEALVLELWLFQTLDKIDDLLLKNFKGNEIIENAFNNLRNILNILYNNKNEAANKKTVTVGTPKGKKVRTGKTGTKAKVKKPAKIKFDKKVLIQNLDEIVKNKGGRLTIAKDGKEIEFETLDISISYNEAQIVFIKKTKRDENKGIGYEIYAELGKRLAEHGIVLQTYGQAQLGPGRNIWLKLVREGIARRLGNNHYEFITSFNPEIPAIDEAPPLIQPSSQDVVEETLDLTEDSIEAKKADIEIGKVGNTEYEVKVDGVYYQGKKLNNPENKTHRQLIEADIKRRRQEELRQNLSKTDFATSFFPALSQPNMSQGGGAYVEINFGKNNVFRLDTYLTPSAINGQYPSITDGTAQLHGEMSDGTKISLPWNQLKDLLNSIKAVNVKGEVAYEFNKNKINAKYDAELAALEGTTSNIVSASFTGQGTTLEIEIKGEKKDFLLTWNRNNTNPTLWGNKKEDGSYTTTDAFPSKEDIQKLVDKYVPIKLLNLINEWVEASKLPSEQVLDTQSKIENKINAELKALEEQSTSAKKADILQKKKERLANVKPMYHHTNVDTKDFNFNNFQRGNKQVSQFGDGLNASSNTTSFLVSRYGKPIQGEVNDADFVKIDASKTEKEVYEELKKQGYIFSEVHDTNDVLSEAPGAAMELFTDFQKSNPNVKGVRVSNHIIGNTKVAPFYVIYDAKSFYGQGALSKKIEQESNAELAALETSTTEDTKDTDINNNDSPFRVDRQSTEPISPSEKFWFGEAFLNAVIVPVTGYIANTAVARVINGTTVMLSSLAKKGSLFHEGYHLVVNNITTAKQRKSVYDDVRNRLGDKEVVTQEGNQLITVVGKNMTDNQVDEWLAEEFPSYMSDIKSYNFPSKKQKSLFEKVLDLINKFLNYFKINKVQDMTMEQLFDTIAKTKALRLKSEFNYRQSAYKVGSFTETQTNELLQAFNSIFFSVAFGKRDDKNNIQWLTIDPERIFKSEQEGIYFDKVYESMKNWMSNNPNNTLFKKLLDNYFDFKKLHTQLIKSYGVEELDELTEEEDKLSTGLRKEGEEANKKSVLTDIPNGIKLLIAALPNVTMNNGKLEFKKTGDFKTTSNVEYEKTLNYLHSLLAGAGSLSAMVQRLESVKNSKPYVQVLLDALDFNTEADTQARLDLRLQFHKQFNKSFLRTVKVVVSGNDITVESALEDSLIARVKQIWLGNTINLSGNGVVDIDIRNGEPIIVKEKAKDWVNAASIKEALDYLALMGITFSKTPGGSLRESQEFLNAAKYIFKRIADSKYNPTVNSLFFRENEGFENTAIKRLILEESKNLDEDIELTVRTPKGETEYSITLPNNLYNLLSELQKGNTPNHLIPFKDGTGNPLTRGSKLLENKTKVSTQILRGIISAEEGFNTSEATYVDFLSSVVNSILTGSSPLIQTADGNLVYTISGLFVNNPNSSLFNNSMRQYLKNELLSTMLLELKGVGSDLKNYKDKAKSLRLFDFLPSTTQANLLKEVKDHLLEKGWNDGNIDILVDDFVDTNKGSMPLVSSSIDSLYANLKAETKALLLDNQLIQPIEGEEGKYNLVGISPNIVTANYSVGLTERYYEVKDVDEEGGEVIYRYNYVNDSDINKIAEVIAYNDVISRIEQINNLFGDLAFYKSPTDVAKRTKLFVSTRENSYNENSFSKEADKFYPRTDGNRRQIHYLKKVIGKSIVINSSIAEIYPSSIKDSYNEIDATDGGSLMTPDGIRDYSLRSGIWDQGQEITFQHIMQGYWRDRKISDEEFKAKFKNHLPENPKAGKTYFKGEEINLNSAKSIMPKKPQGVGPVLDVNGNAYKGLFVPQSDKTAFHIMNWEEMPKDSAVRQLLDWMVDNQTDLYEFDGVNKMSMKDITPILKLENGKEVFTAPKENEITYTSWADIGEQVRNVGERKSKITVSTQMLRLTPANFVPSIEEYYRGDQEKIDSIVELFKQKADEYNKAISNLVTKRKEDLYEELGAVKMGETWLIGQDKIEEFKARLIKILKNKSVADNEIKGVELAFEKVQKFDILLNKSKIEQVLNSMFKNDVVAGKVKGEALVQQSSFGYNANLKSYTESKTGTNIMEVILPISRDLYKWAISKYGTLENFNNNLDKIDQRLIEIPANRIPCQGLNLIDVIKVKRFLPPYAGNRILVPYDFTKKTGSDFDFDKLNTYYNNFYIKNGEIKYLEYITEKNDVAYNQWLDLIAEDEIDNLKAKDVHLRRFISRLNNVQEEIRNASEFMSKSVQDTYFKYITETTGVIPNDWTEALQALKDFRQERILKIEQINSYLGENYVENPEEDILRAKGKKYLPDFKEKEKERKELAQEVRTISESLNNIYETLKAVRERQITNEGQIESAAKAVLTRKENILRQTFDNTPIDQLNSKKSLENKVNELIKWFITRPENFVSLMTPTDQHTEILDNFIQKQYGAPVSPKYSDIIKLKYNIDLAKEFWVGKKGVGSTAIAQVNHASTQLYPIKISSPFVRQMFYNDSKNDTPYYLGHYEDNKGNSIQNLFNGFLSLYVDVAKDPKIKKINIYEETFSVFNFLVRTAKSNARPVNFYHIATFLNQPVIKDYLNRVSNLDSQVLSIRGKNPTRNEVLNELFSSLNYQGIPLFKLYRDAIEGDMSSKEELTKRLEAEEIMDMAYLSGNPDQARVLDHYLLYLEYGKALDQLQLVLRPDSGFPKSRAGNKAYFASLKDMENSGIFDMGDVYKFLNDSYLKPYYDARKESLDIFSKFFMTDSLELKAPFDEMVARMTGNGNEDKVNILEDYFISFVLQKVLNRNNNSLYSEATNMFKSSKDNRTVSEAWAELRKEMPNNVIVKELFAVKNKFIISRRKGLGLDTIKLFNKKMSAHKQDLLANAFREIYDSNPELAKDIIYLSIMRSGNRYTPDSYQAILPNDVYLKLVEEPIQNFINTMTFDKGRAIVEEFENIFRANIVYDKGFITKVNSLLKNGKPRYLLTKRAKGLKALPEYQELLSTYGEDAKFMF